MIQLKDYELQRMIQYLNCGITNHIVCYDILEKIKTLEDEIEKLKKI